MQRRDLIRTLALLSGFPVVIAEIMAGCGNETDLSAKPLFFSPREMKLVSRISDILLPATRTRAASAVGTAEFIDRVVAKCMNAEQQHDIRQGLSLVSKLFHDNTDQVAVVAKTDRDAFSNVAEAAWFREFKKLVLIGFFTSEEGITKASNYVKIPDSYRGETDMAPETLNYGKTNLHY